MFLFCWLIGSSSLFIDELSSNPLRVVNSNVLIDLYDLDAFLSYPWCPWAVFFILPRLWGKKEGAIDV